MNLQLVRRIVLPLTKGGALAVANDVAAWEAQFYGRIVEVETYLGNTGSAAGPTVVDIKKNGVSIFAQHRASHSTRRRNGGAMRPPR